MPKLSESQILDRLPQLNPRWQRLGDMLVRTWQFASPQHAVDFVNRVAEVAARRNHHPDITLRFREVRVELATHAEGGLTEADFETAREIDAIPSPNR
ncbi:MAG: putative pterin-4-alpha-carbinolamine dehydratase [Isosphaeraceae bacterium]|jgi:4a-hydroxytetrahydrobiopterin dehydratase|nr:MAG: putative pterin-4-alpha-carbinolamine dehydratase [Isosphaeraceae bacterium]